VELVFRILVLLSTCTTPKNKNYFFKDSLRKRSCFMKKVLVMIPVMVLCFLFLTMHSQAHAATQCTLKNNNVVWGGLPVTLNTIGRFTVAKQPEVSYTKNTKGSFVKTTSSIKPKAVKMVLSKVKNGSNYFYKTNSNEYYKVSKNLIYQDVPYTIQDCVTNKIFNDNVNSILKQAQQQKTTLEKVLYIHNAIIERTEYGSSPDQFDPMGPLVYGKAVCTGYAYAVNYLLLKLHIPSMMVEGTIYNPDDHAWNIVRIDGAWYYLDATWDDGGVRASYTFFLRPYNDMVKLGYTDPHPFFNDLGFFWGNWTGVDINTKLPSAKSEKYSYLSEMTLDAEDGVTYANGYFYYVDRNGEFWKMSVDGKVKDVLNIGDPYDPVQFLNNKFYLLTSKDYLDSNSNYAIYTISSLSLDGTKTELKTFNIPTTEHFVSYCLEVKNGNIYFNSNDEKTYQITNF
jgi:hypothetical protein